MVFKDQQLLAEAYNLVSEKKHAKNCDCKDCKKGTEKLSPAQKKMAQAAPPPDKITGADFKSLKKVKEELSSFKALYNKVIAEGKKQSASKKK
jgi:hypothetical protein